MNAGSFTDNLASLPPREPVAAILLTGPAGERELIENRPGSQGSLRIYAYLADTFGGLTPEAAREGLRLYAEHVADARVHPGRHPNLDRLLRVAADGRSWAMQLQLA